MYSYLTVVRFDVGDLTFDGVGTLTFGLSILNANLTKEVSRAVMDLFYGSCRTYPSLW